MAGFLTGQRLTADGLNVLFNKPIGRLIQQAVQSLPDATYTAITFGTGSTVYDTNNFHSESSNTSRITPTIAGYYRFSGWVFVGPQTTPVSIVAEFRQNGTTALAGDSRDAGSTLAVGRYATATVLLNGTTDYIELVGNQDSSGAVNTNVSSQFSSSVEWELVRAQ